MSTDLWRLGASDLLEAYERGELSPREVVRAAVERIESVDPLVGAFTTLTLERATEEADACTEELAGGTRRGPLHGVPVAIKELFDVEGARTSYGSTIFRDRVAKEDAEAVRRLRSAGAIVLGLARSHEFGWGITTQHAELGSTRNPWDLERVPGGSSGGAAAAIATGMAPLALGSDTGGSIRIPAAFCGVAGLKPTYGRVSRYGLIAFASSLDCPGPIGKDVTDLALALQAIAGADRRDATAAAVFVPDYHEALDRGVQGLRIGLSPEAFHLAVPERESGEIEFRPIDPSVEAAVRQAAQALRDEGAEIVEGIPLPHARYAIPAYFVISRVEAASNLHRYDGVKYGHRPRGPVEDLRALYRKSRGEGFGTQAKLRILMGMYVSAEQYEEQYYARALRVRTLIRRDFEAAFDPAGAHRLDAILGPTTPTPAFPMGEVYGDSVLMQYADLLTVPANHAGIPGLSIPCGLSKEGLPIGLQLLGPDFSEATLLRIGRRFERATEGEAWRAARPKVLAG